MGVSGVSGGGYPVTTTQKGYAAETGKAAEENKTVTGTADKTVSTGGDTFEKSKEYAIDEKKLTELWDEHNSKVAAFEKMVSALFEKQGIKYNSAVGIKANLEELIASGAVSEEERLAAEQEIGEDGYYGVEKTAQRILDFAKAISGGDPSKIDALRDAVKAGFEGAEKAWGDKLPELCQQTYDRVMQGFDDWANEGSVESQA